MEGAFRTDWVEASIDDLFLVNPKSLPSLSEDARVSFLPMKSVEAMTGRIQLDETRTLGEVRKGYTQFVEGDLLLAKITPCMENGKVAVSRNLANGVGFGSTEFHVMRPIGESALSQWGFWFFLQQRVRRSARQNMTGTAGQLRVPIQYLRNVAIPLPPLVLQRAIVTKIEALFSELDKGVEQLQAVAKQLKRYRQAVLKSAFEGKLTAEWRARQQVHGTLPSAEDLLGQIQAERATRYEQKLTDWKQAVKDWEAAGGKVSGHKKPRRPAKIKDIAPLSAIELADLPGLPNGWRWIKIGEAFSVYVGATPSRKEPAYWGGEIRWVSSGEVAFRDIHDTKEKITELGLCNTSTEVHPVGSVILGMIGEGKTRGQAAILMVPAAHNQNTAAIRVSETPCLSALVFYHLYSNYEHNRRIGGGNNQKALNRSRVQELPFPLIPVAEQRQVLQEIESRFSVLDELEKAVEVGLRQAEALRQGILKTAFEGRLLSKAELAAVKADPTYEPAEVLLERIRAERDRTGMGAKLGRKAGKTKTTGLPKVSGAERYKQAAYAAYAVKRLATFETFGRVQQMKLVYLIPHALEQDSQVHARREAAGPLDPAIHKIESLAKRKSWFTTRKVGQRYVYLAGPKIDEAVEFATEKFGDNAGRVDWLLEQFARFDTERAELLATTFAVWNDHLIDGHEPSEDEVVAGVHGWHPEKVAKFPPDRITKCIQWMKDNSFVPTGIGPKTAEGTVAE